MMSKNHRFNTWIVRKCPHLGCEDNLTLDTLSNHVTTCEFGPGGGFGLIYPLESSLYYQQYLDDQGQVRRCPHKHPIFQWLSFNCTGHAYFSTYPHYYPWSMSTPR